MFPVTNMKTKLHPEVKSINNKEYIMTTNKIKDNGISLTKPKDITPENIKDNIISDDELRKRIIDGTLVDSKLEATLFPNGRKE